MLRNHVQAYCLYGGTSVFLLPIHPHPQARVTYMYITMPSFYIGAGDLNTGARACVTHTLPTELSPQPEGGTISKDYF